MVTAVPPASIQTASMVPYLVDVVTHYRAGFEAVVSYEFDADHVDLGIGFEDLAGCTPALLQHVHTREDAEGQNVAASSEGYQRRTGRR